MVERSKDPTHVCARCKFWIEDDGENDVGLLWGECINPTRGDGERTCCSDGLKCEQFKNAVACDDKREHPATPTPPDPAPTPRDPCDGCWQLADGCIGCEHATGRRSRT